MIDFYKLQIKVMREWQPSGGSRARRLLATLVISVLSFGGAVALTPGYDMVPGAPIIGTLLLAAIVLGVLNIVVRPLFLALFAGISVIAVVIAHTCLPDRLVPDRPVLRQRPDRERDPVRPGGVVDLRRP